MTQYLRFILLSRTVGINAFEYLHGNNYLRNPSLLTDPLSTTTLPIATVQMDDRSDILVVNNADDGDDEEEDKEVEEMNKPKQEDGDNDEIELEEINEDPMKSRNARSEAHGRPYEYVNGNVVLKDRMKERGVRVKYRMDITGIGTSMYMFMMSFTVFAVLFLFRMLRCRLCLHCRLK